MVFRIPRVPRVSRLWPVLAFVLYGVVQPALAPLRSEPAQYLAKKAPDYPPEALHAGIQGTTVLRALVTVSGTASRVAVHKSSGDPQLDAAALKSVQDFQFTPAKTDGVAREAWVKIPIRFAIESSLYTRFFTRFFGGTERGDR